MNRAASIAWVLVALLAGGVANGEAGSAEQAGTSAIEEWLALVDAGRYGESWEAAAALFKGATTKEGWDKTLRGILPPLGELESRKLKGANYATELPGAPDGEYVVAQFDSSFANKSAAVETVTAMKDPDGEWRVAGYFIK